MPFAQFAHFCDRIKPAVPHISRPLIRRSAAFIALGAALRGHLASQQHRHPYEDGHAHYQRRSQRGEIGPHGGLLSTALLWALRTALRTGLPTGLLTGLLNGLPTDLLAGLRTTGPDREGRRARAVSGATQMLNFPGPVTTATACGCCRVCWVLPAPGRETPPRPRHRSAKAPCTPLPPREYH